MQTEYVDLGTSNLDVHPWRQTEGHLVAENYSASEVDGIVAARLTEG